MSRSRTLEKKLYKSTLKIIIYEFMGMYIKSTGHPSALVPIEPVLAGNLVQEVEPTFVAVGIAIAAVRPVALRQIISHS